MQPPLELNDYWIDELAVLANPKYDGEIISPAMLPEIDFHIAKVPRQKKFLLCMTIGIFGKKEDALTAPYRVLITVSGEYQFHKDTSIDTMKKMLAPNGLAILYGLARATVAQATACGRHGKYLLPTVDLIEIIRAKINKAEPGESQPSSRKARKKKPLPST